MHLEFNAHTLVDVGSQWGIEQHVTGARVLQLRAAGDSG